MTDDVRVFNALFLCTGNSARSILAEAILNREGRGRFRAFSAGSRPRGRVDPHAIALLDGLGYDTASLRSKDWNEFAGPDAVEMHFVFTVCDNAAGEQCPVWPGQPITAHWGIPDPAAPDVVPPGDEAADAQRALAFAEAYKQLHTRISLLLSLPVTSLDRLALARRLDEIGRDLPHTA